jgi:NTP pyrophosphatase (non-canonical NTP hydrolase)
MDKTTTIQDIKNIIENFVSTRDWAQFHSPKNLSMAIAIEAAELMNLYKWHTIEESKDLIHNQTNRNEAIDEIADIIIFSLAFANRNNIDIATAIKKKVAKNMEKYPADKYKGKF